jgi:recombination directionality factor gp3-like protein
VAIRDLQVKQTRVGKIRTGKKILSRNGKEMPARLDTFRFTSPAEHLIEEIAALYGGQVKVWERGDDDKQSNRQWEVITDAAMVPVFIPPQKVDPFYESWANGVCVRRCDGLHDTVYDRACDCNPDNRKCKPTTRVNLMLADVPGLGVWGLESHGIYFAGEMVNLFDTISGITMPLPGRLLLENRLSKKYNRDEKKVETSDYNVPVLFIDGVTSRTVQIGSDAVSQSLRLGQEAQAQQLRQAAIEAPRAAAIEAAPARPAVPAGPPAPDIPKALAAIAKASTTAEFTGIRQRIAETGDHPQLLQAFEARQQAVLAEQTRAAAQQRAEAATRAKEARNARLDAQEAVPEATGDDEEAASPAETPAEPAVDIPATEDDPAARKAVFMSLLGTAGTKKVKTSQLEAMSASRFGVALQGLTIAQMEELAGTLE